MKHWLTGLGMGLLLGGCASTELIDETARPAVLMPIEEKKTFELEAAYQVGLGASRLSDIQPMRTLLSSIPKSRAPFAPGVRVMSAQGLHLFPSAPNRWMAHQDGQVLWQKDLEGEIQANSASESGVFYVGTSKGWVYALATQTGELRWKIQLSSEILALSQEASRVFVRTSDGQLSVLKPENGERLWHFERELPKLLLRGASAPLVIDNRVFLGGDAGRLSVLDLQTGRLLADLSLATSTGFTDLARMSDIDAPPAKLADNSLLVQVYQGRVMALDAQSGQVRWDHEISSYLPAWIEAGREIYLVSDRSELIKIDARSGVVLWKNDQLRFRYLGRPILNDGVVYAVDKQGYLHGFDATTGELVARLNLADALHYPLASEGSALLAVTRQGAFYKIGIKTKQ